MFATFLIGLREGMEAALIVAILIAYLVRSGRAASARWVWLGVAAAIAASFAFGGLLQLASDEFTEHTEEVFAGTASLISVGLVTWMVFWMRRASRGLKGELHDKLDAAMGVGAFALFSVGLLAVGREGLETALFLFTAVGTVGATPTSLAGMLLGLAAAVVLGVLFYQGALRINLAKFFRYSGVALLVVAAGVLMYGVHDLQESGILPGDEAHALDVSAWLAEDSLLGVLLKGTIGFRPVLTWLEVAVWVAYLVPAMWFFLRPIEAGPRGDGDGPKTPAAQVAA